MSEISDQYFHRWSNSGLQRLINDLPVDPAPINLDELHSLSYRIMRARELAERGRTNLEYWLQPTYHLSSEFRAYLESIMPTNENTRNVQYFAINPDGTTDMTIRDRNGDPVNAVDRAWSDITEVRRLRDTAVTNNDSEVVRFFNTRLVELERQQRLDNPIANDRNAARIQELHRRQEEAMRLQDLELAHQLSLQRRDLEMLRQAEDIPAVFNEWHIELPPPAHPWTVRPQPNRDADGDLIINTTGQPDRRTATEVGIWRENYRRDGGLAEEVLALQNGIQARIHDGTQRLYATWPIQPKILDFIFHESGWTEVAIDHAPDVLDHSCIMDTGMDTVTPEFIKEDLACIKKHQPKITIVVCAEANKVFFRSDTYWPDIIETAYAKKQQLPESADAQVSVDRAAVPNPGAVFHGPPF